MAISDETTSLLSRDLASSSSGSLTISGGRSSTLEDDEDYVLEIVDEPIDILASSFIAPPGSFGLSGGVGVFGTSLTQRGAGSFNRDTFATPTNGAHVIRRQPSLLSPPNSRSQSCSRRGNGAPIGTGKNGWISTSIEADVEDAEPTEKEPEFLNGITKSQARACFIGVLLTWFVGLKTFIALRQADPLTRLHLLTPRSWPPAIRSLLPTSMHRTRHHGYPHLSYSPRQHSSHSSGAYRTPLAGGHRFYSPCSLSWLEQHGAR